MIPEFPEFKPLNLDDRSDVATVVCAFPPYSDFNFANMYAWDTQGAVRISRLHDNLVFKLLDYLSETPFLTFVGLNRAADTARLLLDLAHTQLDGAPLHFVPEETAQLLAAEGFNVIEDPSSNDYIFSVEHVAGMHNWGRHSSCRRLRQFSDRFPDYRTVLLPLAKIDLDEYAALFDTWGKRRGITNSRGTKEFRAFERLFHLPATNEVTALYADGTLIGFSTFELVQQSTAITQFSKANHAIHPGVCDVLYWEEAKLLLDKGIKYYNWEQDMGIPNLRQSKQKYGPSYFLKKYSITLP